MATISSNFSDADQSVTIDLASLASTSARQSTVVDNSSNKYLDALVQANIKSGSSTPSSDKNVYIYVYGTTGGTTYPEGLTGSDAAYTMNSPSNLILAAVISQSAANTTYNTDFSVAACFGGCMPSKWGIVVVNKTGQALASTGSTITYQGITRTVA